MRWTSIESWCWKKSEYRSRGETSRSPHTRLRPQASCEVSSWELINIFCFFLFFFWISLLESPSVAGGRSLSRQAPYAGLKPVTLTWYRTPGGMHLRTPWFSFGSSTSPRLLGRVLHIVQRPLQAGRQDRPDTTCPSY